jgi:GR25 family glycosyltransferase involved in LPS biosynthesis
MKTINICHYSPLKERYHHMIKQSELYNLTDKLLFITNHDREELNDDDLTLFDLNSLKLCEISLFLKHIQSMKNIIECDNNYGIIMEDDVIFKDNFIDNYNEIIKTLPSNFDIIYMGVFPFYKEYKNYSGNRNPMSQSKTKIGKLYNMDNIIVFPWTGNNKGTDFYIISKEGCIKFLKFIENIKKQKCKINKPIDHFMGQFFYKNGHVYWSEDEITLHGSTCQYIPHGVFENSMKSDRGH